MATPRIASLYYPTKEEIVDLLLRRQRIRAELAGLTLNVAYGSEAWLKADALASVCAHAFANNKIALQQYSPLTATEDKLLELAAEFGVTPRPGAQAQGDVTARCSGVVVIPDGFVATAPNGEKYTAVGPVTITTSGNVTMRAVNAGTAGNQSASTVLTWDNASIGFLQRTMTVTGGGITGGTEEDTWEEVQQRLLAKLRATPVGSNRAQIREWALESTSSVAEAYVYPAVRGPSSFDVCIIGEEGVALSDAVCDEVEAYLASKVGDHVSVIVTSIVDDDVDAVFSLRLPASTSNAGGFTDANPWPRDPCTVASHVGAVIVTNLPVSLDDPVVGDHCYIYAAPSLQGPFEITNVDDDGSGNLEITVTPPPTGDVTDCYISVACENIADYVATVETAFAALGPGEKTASTYILPRGRRRPTVESGAAQMRAGHRIESSLHDEHDEIEEAHLIAVRLTGTTTSHVEPDLPATTSDAPRRLAMVGIGFFNGGD
jgi:uncharacterized phage protein gp47/JayE